MYCPVCGSQKFIRKGDGETFCSKCGTVVEETMYSTTEKKVFRFNLEI